ncbi:unnamed protein product [Cuscuta campestris]|uniref:Rubredoxin-like domain-containing protein n=1 Tax=Cuscuta campestris TaxID=132261 RepID=A0A484MGN1_9ASTE|nr:unnamed protein product [Cuscuta campestris]
MAGIQTPSAFHSAAMPGSSAAGLRRPPPGRFFFSVEPSSSFFAPSSSSLSLLPLKPKRRSAARKISMRVESSKQAYICRDCGYIYNDRKPFENLPDKYFCPVCGAPKRRFRAYEPTVAKNANDTSLRKARKEQLKRDESLGRALPVAIVVGVAALAGLYFYLNNNF